MKNITYIVAFAAAIALGWFTRGWLTPTMPEAWQVAAILRDTVKGDSIPYEVRVPVPLDDVRPLMMYAVREALSLWERRIAVNKCTVTQGNAAGSVSISVEVEVVASAAPMVVEVRV
jgi:hypothetical protein